MKATFFCALFFLGVFASGSAKASLCDNFPHDSHCIAGHEVAGLKVQPKSTNKKLAPRGLYRVEIVCHSTGSLSPDVFDYFVKKELAAGLIVALSEENTGTTPTSEKSKMMMSAYNVGGPATSRTSYMNKACGGIPFFIAPRHPLYVIASESNIETNVLGPALKALESVINIVSSIWPLFTGAEIPESSGKKLGALKDTGKPVQDFISAFDKGRTDIQADLLTEGRTTITARFATVDIFVTPLRSIVLADGGQFQTALDDMLIQMTPKTAISNAADNPTNASACYAIATHLDELQNLSREDIAYSLIVLAKLAGLQQAAQYIYCLGRDYALVAVDQNFVDKLGAGKRFSKENVRTVLPDIPVFPQPDFADVQSQLSSIMGYLRVYEVTVPTPDFANSSLGRLGMTAEVEVNDPEGVVLSSPPAPVKSVDLLKAIKDKGYTRFGCLSPDNRAVAFFFALPEKAPSDKGYTLDDVLLLRAWVNGDTKFFRLELSQDGGQIDAIIQKYKNKCGSNVKFASG